MNPFDCIWFRFVFLPWFSAKAGLVVQRHRDRGRYDYVRGDEADPAPRD